MGLSYAFPIDLRRLSRCPPRAFEFVYFRYPGQNSWRNSKCVHGNHTHKNNHLHPLVSPRPHPSTPKIHYRVFTNIIPRSPQNFLCYPKNGSLLRSLGNSPAKHCKDCVKSNQFREFHRKSQFSPVISPVSREFEAKTGSLRTACTQGKKSVLFISVLGRISGPISGG
jgi:hypothetical protein